MEKKDTKFQKGCKGGPGRKKKSETYSDILREILAAKKVDITWVVDGKDKAMVIESSSSMYHGIAASQIMEALKGDTKAAKEIVDRVEGKAKMSEPTAPQGEKQVLTIGGKEIEF